MINLPKTKEEIAYELLKDLILRNELPKNQFLSQRMLAEKVKTNLSTIRTVLRQLESDNLIENVPQWGVRIPEETEEVLRDRYYIRELLEVGAVKLIVKNRENPTFNKKAIIEKAEICDAISRELPKNINNFAQAHFEFHLELAKKSGSALLLQNLSRLHFQSFILQNAQRGWAFGAFINHTDMVNIILNGTEKDAVAFTIKHIRGGLESELQTLLNQKTL